MKIPREDEWRLFEKALAKAMEPRDERGREVKARVPWSFTLLGRTYTPMIPAVFSCFLLAFIIPNFAAAVYDDYQAGRNVLERWPDLVLVLMFLIPVVVIFRYLNPMSKRLHKQFVKRRDAHYGSLVVNARSGDTSGLDAIPFAATVADLLYKKEVKAVLLHELADPPGNFRHDVDVDLGRTMTGSYWLNELGAIDSFLVPTKPKSPSSKVFTETVFGGDPTVATSTVSDAVVRLDHVVTVDKQRIAVALKLWDGTFAPGTKGRLFECEGVEDDVLQCRYASVDLLVLAARKVRAPIALMIVDKGSVEGELFKVSLKDCELVIAEFDAAVMFLRDL